ncbi:MAG: hypothetical protein M5U10_11590 [Candidatus Methanoperedens sp.]|nr:hypothetical protein [Candidatus Methanoperedens sp.]
MAGVKGVEAGGERMLSGGAGQRHIKGIMFNPVTVPGSLPAENGRQLLKPLSNPDQSLQEKRYNLLIPIPCLHD